MNPHRLLFHIWEKRRFYPRNPTPERQKIQIREQISEIVDGIHDAKRQNAERFTIKQLEKTKKSLEVKLKKLSDEERKDDTICFEELGVDRLFVDEAHSFKNLFTPTKMRNVAGIGQSEAIKSSDMYMKTRYMDEITGGRGIVFATGTPISNSMTELHVMMRYLQHDMLKKTGLLHFDSWAAAFGEKVTAVEVAPSGQGVRSKTRFARFFNLPELMSLWKDAADVQTADMLKLPVPEAEHITVKTGPSDWQKEAVREFSVRADMVQKREVLPHEDNMLKITSDGRKLALDQRLYDASLPDEPDNKANSCAKNVLEVWRDTAADRGTQLIFCDLSTPNGDGKFNVYDDLKAKLMAGGIPEKEIAYIHNAETEAQKAALFAKVRKGQVRILLGSTQKMGAGTNVQDHLAALHHLDAPWRPADIEQREGRILRFGNQNKHVKIYKYVTEQTFDSYSWAILENKQKFIGQIMTSKSPARSIEDVDATALSYAEIKALAAGDERIKEKMSLDIDVTKLKLLKANHDSQRYTLEDKIAKYYPQSIQKAKEKIAGFTADWNHLGNGLSQDFSISVGGVTYTERKLAGEAIGSIVEELRQRKEDDTVEIGSYRGFPMTLSYNAYSNECKVFLKGGMTYSVNLGHDIVGNTIRISNLVEDIPKMLSEQENKLATLQGQFVTAQEEVQRPFERDAELLEKSTRLTQLNIELDMNSRESDAAAEIEVTDPEPRPQGVTPPKSIASSHISRNAPPEKKPSILAKLAAGVEGFQKNSEQPGKERTGKGATCSEM